MSKIVDAVTAVITCGDELLMVRRQPFLAAFAGFHAFPGGKIDTEDGEGAPLPVCCADFDPRLMRGLLRELHEELQLDVAALPAAPVISKLGLALTPPGRPFRFNTTFYRLELAAKPAVHCDTQEITDAEWATPAAWLARYRDGDLLLAPPTRWVVNALAADFAAPRVPEMVDGFTRGAVSCFEHVAGVRMLEVRSNTLPPAQHTNCFLLGDSQSHRILVDPSPRDDAEMHALCELVAHYGIHEVFLTHHHPDHHERAPQVAQHFGVPIGMSLDTQQRIHAKHGQGYFDGLAVHHYQDGDLICRWMNQAVRVIAVPGHDEGQLALMPDSRAWCIVGDLIQGVGTVVIAAPEGDMRKYYASLQRIIDLDPRVIIPSHGQPLGSTYRLIETLRHRQLREQQILSLWQDGHEHDAILAHVYTDIDPRLLPLARKNIDSHLLKLQQDGVLAR